MRAIILAAGRGSRMDQLTVDRPKCLLEFRGKALLDWQIEALRDGGVTSIAVVTGYRAERLEGRDLTFFHNRRWAETNMVTSLACAAAWLEAAPCIVSYADIIYEAPAVASLTASNAPLAITYDPAWRRLWELRFDDPLQDAETFRLKPDGTVADIGGCPRTLEEIEGQYMGLLRFTPSGWREFRRIHAGLTAEEGGQIHMTGMLQRVVAAGVLPLLALPFRGFWAEFDSAADLNVWRTPNRHNSPECDEPPREL